MNWLYFSIWHGESRFQQILYWKTGQNRRWYRNTSPGVSVDMTKMAAQSGLIHLETLISKVKQDTGALYGYGTGTKCGSFKPVNDPYQILNKQWKTCTDLLPLEKSIYYHNYELQHEHGQCNSMVSECS